MQSKSEYEDKAFEDLATFETYLSGLQALQSALENYRLRFNSLNWQMAELVIANNFELKIPNNTGDNSGSFRHTLKNALDQGQLILTQSNTVEIYCKRTGQILCSQAELFEELANISKDLYGG